jgi:hypothetical protein
MVSWEREFTAVPLGFSDPCKQSSGRQERGLDASAIAGAGTFTIAAVVVGAVASVATGGIVTAAGAGVVAGIRLFRAKARWTREDPPRDDFADPEAVTSPTLRMLDTLYPQVDGELPELVLGAARLGERLYLASAALQSSILNVERAQGAWLASEREFVWARYSDARGNALLAADLIRAAAGSCFDFAERLPEDLEEPAAEEVLPAGRTFLEVVEADALVREIVGRAGIELSLLDAPIVAEPLTTLLPAFRASLLKVGADAMDFSQSLATWGTEPPPDELARLSHPLTGGGGGFEGLSLEDEEQEVIKAEPALQQFHR